MTFWFDAQLSPSLAAWLTITFGVTAHAVRDLGLRDAEDRAIFDAARAAGTTVITKDSDFVDLVNRLGTPPQVLYLTCGNTSNERVRGIFTAHFPQAQALLASGEPIVEIADGIPPASPPPAP